MNQTAKDLLAAARYIQRNGWCRCRGFSSSRVSPDADGVAACALGAIAIATGYYDAEGRLLRPDRYVEAERVLASVVCSDVVLWNDQKAANSHEVISGLERAALCANAGMPLTDDADKPAEFFVGPPQPLTEEATTTAVPA